MTYGMIKVQMSVDEAVHMRELEVRDMAMGIVVDEKYDLRYCPTCKNSLLPSNNFCPKCGQRIDWEAIAL